MAIIPLFFIFDDLFFLSNTEVVTGIVRKRDMTGRPSSNPPYSERFHHKQNISRPAG
jgi:hypothetical protein